MKKKCGTHEQYEGIYSLSVSAPQTNTKPKILPKILFSPYGESLHNHNSLHTFNNSYLLKVFFLDGLVSLIV